MNLPRSGTPWVTGAGTLVGATGGGTVAYILELLVVSAFPLDPETTVGMGFPTDESFVVSSLTPVAVAKKQCIDILQKSQLFCLHDTFLPLPPAQDLNTYSLGCLLLECEELILEEL